MTDEILLSWKKRMKVMEALITTVKSLAALMVANDEGEPDKLTIRTLKSITHMVSVVADILQLSKDDIDIILVKMGLAEDAIKEVLTNKDISSSTIDDFIQPSA